MTIELLAGVAAGALIWWLLIWPRQLNAHERRRRRVGLTPQRELPEDRTS